MAGIIGATLMVGLWQCTPLRSYADPSLVSQWLRNFRQSHWSIVVILVAYLVTSLVMFPNTALNVAVVLTFSGLRGVTLAVGGSLLAAIIYYEAGRRYGMESSDRRRHRRLADAKELLRTRGILGVLSVRLLPVAPFSIVNVLAGMIRIPRLAYLTGSFIGLLPGPVLVSVFDRQVRQALRNPGPPSIWLLFTSVALGVVTGALACRKARPRVIG